MYNHLTSASSWACRFRSPSGGAGGCAVDFSLKRISQRVDKVVVLVHGDAEAVAVLILSPLVKGQLIAHILAALVHDDFVALQPLDAVNDAVRAFLAGDSVHAEHTQLRDGLCLRAVASDGVEAREGLDLFGELRVNQAALVNLIEDEDALLRPLKSHLDNGCRVGREAKVEAEIQAARDVFILGEVFCLPVAEDDVAENTPVAVGVDIAEVFVLFAFERFVVFRREEAVVPVRGLEDRELVRSCVVLRVVPDVEELDVNPMGQINRVE